MAPAPARHRKAARWVVTTFHFGLRPPLRSQLLRVCANSKTSLIPKLESKTASDVFMFSDFNDEAARVI